jgi:hypothetical protein
MLILIAQKENSKIKQKDDMDTVSRDQPERLKIKLKA